MTLRSQVHEPLLWEYDHASMCIHDLFMSLKCQLFRGKPCEPKFTVKAEMKLLMEHVPVLTNRRVGKEHPRALWSFYLLRIIC